ncbi:MAG: hypothetical protein JPMHGGIA_02507 [Saprospiraceae bacterium]|jgi:lycopene cyclase domain-containing protein|nr:lycopene cyclase domain-containing protein [Saprospiraceae bacterium]MBV6474203.1 hypothetical protein [Saprospiraceae bacterium]
MKPSQPVTLILLAITLLALPPALFSVQAAQHVADPGPWWKIPALETRGLYLIHHLIAFVPVFFFGIVINLFDYRKQFVQLYLWPLLLLAPVFIAWDAWFNAKGIWSFSKSYSLGWNLLGLPIEEWSWFYVIPFCCFFVLTMVRMRFAVGSRWDRWLLPALAMPLLFAFVYGMDSLYTAWSAGSALFVLVAGRMLGVSGLGEFLVAFAINLVPMFLLNGMLTGLFTDRALVQYNPLEFSNIRIGTFPVEDLGFGFAFLYGVEVLSSVIRK